MLTFKFIPYKEIEELPTKKRLDKIIALVKENEIVLLEGRLTPNEETRLIARTMEEIDDDFKGIEISVLHNLEADESFMSRVRAKLIDLLLGDSYGLTIIGSAKVIKEIKQDPGKIQLLAEDLDRV